jgi:molybdopterin synthase sulfur carrier subunit
MATVTLRYWAAARDAAGVASETVSGRTLEDALAAGLRQAAARGRERQLAAVLARCSYLVDGAPAGTRPRSAVELAEESTVEVLPPFAGG